MKVNANTVLVGQKLLLVPYQFKHVEKYHEWMLDEELRTLTASEPLTLEQEYEMQRKWQEDEDKLTFIILARDVEQKDIQTDEQILPEDPRIAYLPMIGDVNIFLNGTLPDLASAPAEEDEDAFEAEVEIMIAESSYRRRGCAREALQLILTYATGSPESFVGPNEGPSKAMQSITSPLNISPNYLVTRISEKNEPSIRSFEKLGFKITKRVEVFEEVEMRWRL